MKNVFLKGTAWASFANFLFLGIGYVAQILIGRSLTPAEYSSFGVAIYLLNLIEYVVVTGISQSLSKSLAERPLAGGSIIRHSILAQVFLVTVVSIPLWLLSPWLADWFGDQGMTTLLQVVALILPFYGVRGLLQGILAGQQEFTSQSKIKIVIAIVKFALIVLALLLKANVTFILVAYLLSSLAGAIFGWHYLKPIHRAESVPAGHFYKSAFSLTVFLVIFPLFINIDVFLVKRLVASSEQAGWYVAAATLARMPFYLFTGLLLTLLPSVAHLKETAFTQLQRMVKEINRYALLLLLPLTVFIALTASDIIPLIFGRSYRGGEALSVLIISISLLVMFRIFSTILVGLTNPARATITTILVLGFDILLNITLIPRFGIMGAAYASALSSLAGLLVSIIQLDRYKLALFDFPSLKRAVAACIIPGLLLILHPINWWLVLSLTAGLALYVGLLFLFKEIQPKDIARLQSLLHRERTQESPAEL